MTILRRSRVQNATGATVLAAGNCAEVVFNCGNFGFSRFHMTDIEPLIAKGKKLLIQAGLRLAVHTRSIRALGVRELGREAGLNPNTFYRHFKGMDDLGLAMINSVVGDLRQPLRDLRRKAAEPLGIPAEDDFVVNLKRTRLAKWETVKLFFQFVEGAPEAFIVGVSELHGSSPVLRQALRDVLRDFATDMAEDFRALGLLPMLDDETIGRVSTLIIETMFYKTTEYIEKPERRAAILAEADKCVRMMLIGAIAGQINDERLLPKLVQVLGPGRSGES
jgi:AcrR family transcriptional regulator